MGRDEHQMRRRAMEIWLDKRSFRSGEIREILELERDSYSYTEGLPSERSIQKWIKNWLHATKSSDEWLNESFEFSVGTVDRLRMKKDGGGYGLSCDSDRLLLALWSFAKSFVIRPPDRIEINWTGKELGLTFSTTWPLVTAARLKDSEHHSGTITNRHAYWACRIQSACKGLGLLDILLFAVEFAKEEIESEILGRERCFENLWAYLAYHPWADVGAATRYRAAVMFGQELPLKLGACVTRRNTVDLGAEAPEGLAIRDTKAGAKDLVSKESYLRRLFQAPPIVVKLERSADEQGQSTCAIPTNPEQIYGGLNGYRSLADRLAKCWLLGTDVYLKSPQLTPIDNRTLRDELDGIPVITDILPSQLLDLYLKCNYKNLNNLEADAGCPNSLTDFGAPIEEESLLHQAETDYLRALATPFPMPIRGM